MSHGVKLRLLALGVIIVLAGVLLWEIPSNIEQSAAAQSGPPTINTAKVKVDPPASGATIQVTVAYNALGNADQNTLIKVANLTRGEESNEVNFDPVSGNYLYVLGAGGDVLQLHARNGADGATANLGFVPNPADIARPNYDRSKIHSTYPNASGNFQIDGDTKSLLDESFPLTAVLLIDGGSASSPQSIAANPGYTYNASAFTFEVPASQGDRAILQIIDDFGNVTEMHYQVGVAVANRSDGFFPTGFASATQATSERTGLAPTAGIGVLLPGLEFLHSELLYHLSGPVMGLAVQATYRSGISYDGPLGSSWDWMLDSRLEIGTTDAKWYTGDGRVEIFTNRTYVPSELHYIYTSPDGVFTQLVNPRGGATDYYLTARSGLRLVFHGDTGLLRRIEDAYGQDPANPGNRINIVRNDYGYPVEIQDEVGRRVALSWYGDTGRLAEIKDFGGRRIQFEYDLLGRLENWTRADGSATSYAYDGTTGNLSSITDAAGSVILENDYLGTGEIDEQRDAMCLENGGEYSFDVVSNPQDAPHEVDVTDPDGALVRHGFTNLNTQLVLEAAPTYTRWYSRASDRGQGSGFPGTADPASWEETYDYNDDLLLTEISRNTAGGPYTEKVTLAYMYVLDGDPRKKGRLRERVEEGDGTVASRTWTWDYLNDSYWPTKLIDPVNQETTYEYNTQGQLIESLQTITIRGNPATPGYDIIEKYSYDNRGRLTAYWSPNRIAEYGELSKPSIEYSYHSYGLGAGFLSQQLAQDSIGSPAEDIVTAYDYDTYGRVVARTDPNGSVWETEYDDANRVTVALEPEVTRTFPGASGTMQGETRYVYLNDRLDRIERVYDTADGAPSPWPIVETTYEYGSHGVLSAIERDADKLGKEERTEYSYNGRGDQIELRKIGLDELGQPTYISERSSYDARGLVLSRTDDPEYGASQSSADDIVTWYAYDIAGRPSEVSKPGASDPILIHYDSFGQRETLTSPEADLGFAHEGTPLGVGPTIRTGRVQTAWSYDDAGRVIKEELRTAEQSLSNWMITAATRIDYDEANRAVRRHTALVEDPTIPIVSTEWATDSVDLFPGGQVHRSYYAQHGYSYWAENDLDDFERVVQRTSTVGNVIEAIYEPGTGFLEKRQDIPYDELNLPESYTFEQSYVHDELGRVIESKTHGNILASPLPEVTGSRVAYDGLGRVVRSSQYNFSSLEESDVTTHDHDLRGFVLKTVSGCGCAGAKETQYSYDLWGRLDSKTEKSNSLTDRSFDYHYDALGRRTSVDLPERAQGVSRSNSYTYETGAYTLATMTDALGVAKDYSYNDLGMLIEVQVAQVPPAWVDGPKRLTYRYGLPDGSKFRISSQPLIASTFEKVTDQSAETVVRQRFNTQALLTEERTQVVTSCVHEASMAFTYDVASQRLRIETHFPTDEGSDIQRMYRRDGLVDETLIHREDASQGGSSWYTLTKNYYLGKTLLKTDTYEPNPNLVTSTVHSSRMYTIDSKGNRTQLDVTDGASGTLLTDSATYDWQSRMLSKRQSGSGSSGLWSHMKYGDGGRLLDAIHGSVSSSINWTSVTSSTHGGEFSRQSMSYNDFGELADVSQYFEQDQISQSFSYQRDLAGFVTGVNQNQLFRVFPNDPTNYQEKLLGQSYEVDDNGTVKTVDVYYWKENDEYCSGSDTELEDAEINQLRTLDAWGRVVETAKTVDNSPSAHDCFGVAPQDMETYVVTMRYDAFGRRVYYQTWGADADPREVMHTYEYNEIVSSLRLKSCGQGGQPDGRFAERHISHNAGYAGGYMYMHRRGSGGGGAKGGGASGGGFPPPDDNGEGEPEPGDPLDADPDVWNPELWGPTRGKGGEIGRTYGPLCGPYPPGGPEEEIYTVHSDLLGIGVLSNRDFDSTGAPIGLGGEVGFAYDYGDTFTSRELYPWGGIATDGFEDHQHAQSIEPGSGFSTWLLDESAAAPEAGLIAAQGMTLAFAGVSEVLAPAVQKLAMVLISWLFQCPDDIVDAIAALRGEIASLEQKLQDEYRKIQNANDAWEKASWLDEFIHSARSNAISAVALGWSAVMGYKYELALACLRLSKALRQCWWLQSYPGEAEAFDRRARSEVEEGHRAGREASKTAKLANNSKLTRDIERAAAVAMVAVTGYALGSAAIGGGGGATGLVEVTFGHGARHLAGTGLREAAVEGAIRTRVVSIVAASSSTGEFWGRVTVSGQTLLYRAYTLASNRIHVGTYYPVGSP